MMSINKMFLLSISLLAASCSSDTFISRTGNMPSEDRIAMVFKGQSKNDVLEVLGSPSTVAPFDDNTWIYMSSEIRQIAFMAPEEINRELLVVKFDGSGTVSSINKFDKEHGEQLAIAEDQTPNQEQEQGFFRKYFGGVGQYMPFGGNSNNGMEP